MGTLINGSLKGVLSKNLQKPYRCGRGRYNSWSDNATDGYHELEYLI